MDECQQVDVGKEALLPGHLGALVLLPKTWTEASAAVTTLSACASVSEICVISTHPLPGESQSSTALDTPHVRTIWSPSIKTVAEALNVGVRHLATEAATIYKAGIPYSDALLTSLMSPILAGNADMVIGSRTRAGKHKQASSFTRSINSSIYTLLACATTNLNMTDASSPYIAYRTSKVRDLIPLDSSSIPDDGLLAIMAATGSTIFETPLTGSAGLGASDKGGPRRIWDINRQFRRKRKQESRSKKLALDSGHAALASTLSALEGTDNYHLWIFRQLSAHLHGRILELGAGTGTFTRHLERNDLRVIATEPDPQLFESLKRSFSASPSIAVIHADDQSDSLNRYGPFDCIVLINVLEHIRQEKQAVQRLYELLQPGGHLLIWVPAHDFLYSKFDRDIGHHRRYSISMMRNLLLSTGFEILDVGYRNPVGAIAWMIVAKLGRTRPTTTSLSKAYDRYVVPLQSRSQIAANPPFGQSVLAIARKPKT